jgi:CheY-like chemotaxis protein
MAGLLLESELLGILNRLHATVPPKRRLLRCLASGMDDYVAKPFNADTLDGVLRRWTEAGA